MNDTEPGAGEPDAFALAANSPPPPEDHFKRLRPRTAAPPVASIAARSLPLLGTMGVLLTVFLAVGSVRGELPYFGTATDANAMLAVALLTIGIWAVYLLWKVPQWQADAWARSGMTDPRELFKIENESRGTLGQILSGVAVLSGLIFAWQQLGNTSDNLRVSSEGQITDRFTSAVDQLGSDQLTVRLGGIYALERIARDSPRDYRPVMEVLTAFVRQESPLPANAAATPVVAASPPPPDVEAVLGVISRRTPEQVTAELEQGDCLDLTGISAIGADLIEANLTNTCWDRSDLRGAQLARADLTGATLLGSDLSQQTSMGGVIAPGVTFSGANLSNADLSRADLSEANLLSSNLTGAILQGTDLSGANLIKANMAQAIFFGTDLSGADLLDANLAQASLTGVNLTGTEHLTAEQLSQAFVDAATELPESAKATPAP